MQASMNISAAFAYQAEANAASPAIVFTDGALSYDQIRQLYTAFARRLNSLGVDHSSTLMLSSEDPQVILATLLAAAHVGAAVVQSVEESVLPASLQITHRFHTPVPGMKPAPNSVLIDAGWSPATNRGDLPPGPEQNIEKPWLWVYTSGPTGTPKFIFLSQRMVYHRSMAVSDEFIAGTTRFASLMPCSSRTFLARAFAALLNGATIVGGTNAKFWQEAGVTMVSATLAQMVRFLGETTISPRLPLAEVMESRASEKDVRLLLRSFETVQVVFDAAETSVAFANVNTLEAGELQSKGQLRDTEIHIVDMDDTPVATGETGTLRLRNPYMANGYLNDSTTEKSAFRDGWFYSGDIAAWGPTGTLQLRDRSDHVVNIGGVKINAFTVDQIFRSIDGIQDAICFKNPKNGSADELFAFVVFAEGSNRLQAVESAKYQCREKLGNAMVPRVIQGVAGIPRRADGTPDRHACAELILSIHKAKHSSEPTQAG